MDTILSQSSFRYSNEPFNQWFEVIYKVTEFTSVNNLHGINTQTKVIYDQPWVTKFKQEMAEQLVAIDPVSKCDWITNGKIYYLANTFIIKHHFFNRDLDNMQKITQDCISDAVHINDSHIVENHNYKAYRPGDYEYLISKFGISNYNYNKYR